MKYQFAQDLRPDPSIGLSRVESPKNSDDPVEKIQLTPTPFAVFKALSEAKGQELDYGTLKFRSGMEKVNSFPKHIQELVAKGIVQCLGPHRERYVILRVDPARIELVQRYARKTSQHSRPDINTARKKRKCLSCLKTFASEWAGMRICAECKTAPAWQDADNPYTPEGDTDGSGLSDLTTGLY